MLLLAPPRLKFIRKQAGAPPLGRLLHVQ